MSRVEKDAPPQRGGMSGNVIEEGRVSFIEDVKADDANSEKGKSGDIDLSGSKGRGEGGVLQFCKKVFTVDFMKVPKSTCLVKHASASRNPFVTPHIPIELINFCVFCEEGMSSWFIL